MGRASERARERETFRYDSYLIRSAAINESTSPLPPALLSTSADTTLTAFAQLAAVRLQATRAIVSLFDKKYQYAIAEATQASPLTPGAKYQGDGAWLTLCGTAIPRAFGVCEHVLGLARPQPWSASGAREECRTQLPVSVIPNLMEDARFSGRSYCQSPFYAGTPIRTGNGIDIGVLSVFDDKPRDGLDPTSAQVMRDLSAAIMSHLENKRAQDAYSRSQRMVRGIGSFVEGKATISGWAGPAGPVTSPAPVDPSYSFFDVSMDREGALNGNQQQLAADATDSDTMSPDSVADPEQGYLYGAASAGPSATSAFRPGHIPPQDTTGSATHTGSTSPPQDINQTFRIVSKAANILREAIEVEGVVFLDASVHSFGGLRDNGSASDGTGPDSQEDVGTNGLPSRKPHPHVSPGCRILGFSTSDISSIDGNQESSFHLTVPEKMLAKLLRRYPEGKIFNFDEHGYAFSRDSSGDEDAVRIPEPQDVVMRQVLTQATTGRGSRHQQHNDGSAIIKIFSGARSIALVPVWDSRRQRWFAGGFAFTKNPRRILTLEGELSYLRAFGTVVMAEISRAEIALADGAKSDALSSISHELRSPLHGLLLAAELLSYSKFDAFQGNMLHTIETCGRTLLDTIDHLLDYTKINNFMKISKVNKTNVGARGFRRSRKETIEAGMTNISAVVQLDLIVEEVVESLFFAHNFQRMTLAQMEKQMPSGHEDVYALRSLGSMDASIGASKGTSPAKKGLESPRTDGVSIRLDIDPREQWLFHTQPGAVRRILMNLVGNSLKYTRAGTVKVSLAQDATAGKRRDLVRSVRIVVQDTGNGIGQDYLKNHLFKPFTQEDSMAAGTGLGLSMVKRITSSLGGSIKVESTVGVGTKICIRIPMVQANPSASRAALSLLETEFNDQVNQLTGLRVRFHGFGERGVLDGDGAEGGSDDLALMEKVCQEWLRMRVITEREVDDFSPDLVLCTEDSFLQLSTKKTAKQPPTVTICRDVLTARQLSMSFGDVHSQGVFEFVSQPAGPRKLAKVLLLCFSRWVELQFSPSSVDSQPSGELNVALKNSTLPATPGLNGSKKTPTPPPNQPPEHAEPPLEALPPLEGPKVHTLSELSNQLTTFRQGISHQTLQEVAKEKYLLVDDNAINLKILTAYMLRLGYICVTATNGKEAYDKYTQTLGHFQWVFMDISMPVMDGLEASRLIRAYERERQLRPAVIIALTGLASMSVQQDAFASGINLFLTKPVRLKELTLILKRQRMEQREEADKKY